jgi:hypothetical protein
MIGGKYLKVGGIHTASIFASIKFLDARLGVKIEQQDTFLV